MDEKSQLKQVFDQFNFNLKYHTKNLFELKSS
jgi:hypothetical protein